MGGWLCCARAMHALRPSSPAARPPARLPAAAAAAGHLSHSPHGFSKLHRPDVTFSCGSLLFPAHSLLLAGARAVGGGGEGSRMRMRSHPCCRFARFRPLASPPTTHCYSLLSSMVCTVSSRFWTEFFSFIQGQHPEVRARSRGAARAAWPAADSWRHMYMQPAAGGAP